MKVAAAIKAAALVRKAEMAVITEETQAAAGLTKEAS